MVRKRFSRHGKLLVDEFQLGASEHIYVTADNEARW